jgi:hypothetical protein
MIHPAMTDLMARRLTGDMTLAGPRSDNTTAAERRGPVALARAA